MRWLLAFCCLVCSADVWAEEKPLKVVATLSTFADLAKTIGGDRVEVSTIVPPKMNPHTIEPKPSDVLRVKRADLFIHGGLDLEAWRGPLLDAAGKPEVMSGGPRELDLSRGVALLEVPEHTVSRAEGDIHIYGNPHYWLDPMNGNVIAESIADKLAELDPEHAETFRGNLRAFLARLDAKLPAWRSKLAPVKGMEVVAHHNEWPYFFAFAGIEARHFLEPKPGIPPTPRQVQFIEQYVSAQRVPLIVKAAHEPQQAAQAVSQRTGLPVAILCHTVGELPECGDYMAMFDYNVEQVTQQR